MEMKIDSADGLGMAGKRKGWLVAGYLSLRSNVLLAQSNPDTWPPRIWAVITGEKLRMRTAERSWQAGGEEWAVSKEGKPHDERQRKRVRTKLGVT